MKREFDKQIKALIHKFFLEFNLELDCPGTGFAFFLLGECDGII